MSTLTHSITSFFLCLELKVDIWVLGEYIDLKEITFHDGDNHLMRVNKYIPCPLFAELSAIQLSEVTGLH